MPNVDFYLVKETNLSECYLFVCKLVEKAYQRKHNIYIHTDSAVEAKTLDDMLWTFDDISFIPHSLQQDPIVEDVPVRIGHAIHPAAPYDVLINLTAEIPNFFNHYHRVLEIVPQDPAWKDSARKKYKLYKEKSCELITHDLTKN